MAGATQLVVTGAFARASLSLAAYQLLATRKRPERMSYKKKKPERKSDGYDNAVTSRPTRETSFRFFGLGINETRSRNADYKVTFIRTAS